MNVVRLSRHLPREWPVRVLGTQLLRAGTAVAANYRASCRARSDKEFVAKLGVVAEEADESLLWLELLVVASPSIAGQEHARLLSEANELTAIFSASCKTARANLEKKRRNKKLADR
jgi:four helix bundle protein